MFFAYVRFPAKADVQDMLRLKILNKHAPIGDSMQKGSEYLKISTEGTDLFF
jgi:hypothetical protein